MVEFIEKIICMLLGAMATAVPLYYKIRSMNFQFKTQTSKANLKETSEHLKLEAANRINHEAEWKRIIEFRDAEMTRLRERDDQQEEKIKDLYAKHLECQRSEAKSSERIIVQNEQIKVLLEKLNKLEEILIQRGVGS